VIDAVLTERSVRRFTDIRLFASVKLEKLSTIEHGFLSHVSSTKNEKSSPLHVERILRMGIAIWAIFFFFMNSQVESAELRRLKVIY